MFSIEELAEIYKDGAGCEDCGHGEKKHEGLNGRCQVPGCKCQEFLWASEGSEEDHQRIEEDHQRIMEAWEREFGQSS